MFTAAKENEFKDEAGEAALVQDIKALNFNRKPRYSVKRRKMPDSLADEATFKLSQQMQVLRCFAQEGDLSHYATEPKQRLFVSLCETSLQRLVSIQSVEFIDSVVPTLKISV